MEFNMKMTLAEIIENHHETTAIQILAQSIEHSSRKMRMENAEMSSSLKAIRKINKASIHSDAVDALCEVRT